MKKSTKWELSVQYGRDIHAGRFVEAICEHGVGHHRGTHGCDGCCADWPVDISSRVSED